MHSAFFNFGVALLSSLTHELFLEHSTGNITLALALGLVFGIIILIMHCIITVWMMRRKSHSKQILTSQSSFQD